MGVTIIGVTPEKGDSLEQVILRAENAILAVQESYKATNFKLTISSGPKLGSDLPLPFIPYARICATRNLGSQNAQVVSYLVVLYTASLQTTRHRKQESTADGVRGTHDQESIDVSE